MALAANSINSDLPLSYVSLLLHTFKGYRDDGFLFKSPYIKNIMFSLLYILKETFFHRKWNFQKFSVEIKYIVAKRTKKGQDPETASVGDLDLYVNSLLVLIRSVSLLCSWSYWEALSLSLSFFAFPLRQIIILKRNRWWLWYTTHLFTDLQHIWVTIRLSLISHETSNRHSPLSMCFRSLMPH